MANFYDMREYSLFGNLKDEVKRVRVVDGDGIADVNNIGFRVAGLDTNEIDHGREEDLYSRTWSGEVQKEVLEYLLDNGFNGIKYTGETDNRRDDGKPREIIHILNPETNQSSADVMYYQGLVGLRGGGGPFAGQNISPRHLKLYRQGQLAREGGEESKIYDGFRKKLKEADAKDRHIVKEIAPSEFAFDPDQHRDVYIRHSDRDIFNEARSPWKSSISGGVDTLHAGFWGVTEMVGNRLGFNHLEDTAREYKEANLHDIRALPKWTSDIHDVRSVGDFAEWGVGALGGSLPFFALIAAGFLPVPGAAAISMTSMSLLYTGMTINDMKGDISKKSFTKGLTAGFAQAWFERLGGKFIFGTITPAKFITKKGNQEAIEQYAKKKNISIPLAKQHFAEAKKSEMVDFLSDIKRNDVIWKLYAQSIGARAASGLVGEAATEAAQEAAQYAGAYWGSAEGEGVFDKEEFRKIIVNAAAAGGLLGAGLGAGISAYSEDSPISLRVRQHKHDQGMNTKYNVDNPLDMADIIKTSSATNIERDWIIDSDNNVVVETNVKENQEYADSQIDKFNKQQKEKSTLGRAGEVLKDNEALSTGYTVLLKRLGDLIHGSDTLKAEMSFSGWIKDRFAFGQSHVQNKRTFEGRQHDSAFNILQELRVSLGIRGDRQKNRARTYEILRDYALIPSQLYWEGKKGEGLEENYIAAFLKKWDLQPEDLTALRRAHDRFINEYEALQTSIYQIANDKYGPMAGHTFTDRKLAPTKVEKKREEFINILMNEYAFTDKEANAEADYIETVPGGYDAVEFANTDFLTKKPIGLKMRDRYDPSDEVFKDFWEENTYDSLRLRATEVSHYVADTIATGFGGDKLNSRIIQIRNELIAAHGEETADRWMPEITNTIYNHYKAHRGEYHKIKDDDLRAMFSNAGALMALAYMPMAVFASIPEVGLAFLHTDKELFLKAAKKSAKMGAQGIADQFRKIANEDINENERQFALEIMRRRGMLSHEYGMGHVIDAEFGNDRRNWLQRKVMPAFYRWTGLTGFTTAMRMIRDSISLDYIANQIGILEHALYPDGAPDFVGPPVQDQETYARDFREFTNREARAFSKLKELGGDPRGVVKRFRNLELGYEQKQAGLREDINTKVAEQEGYAGSEAHKADMERLEWKFEDWLMHNKHSFGDPLGRRAMELAREIDLMRSNFVDSGLVNPDPGRRPLFYSDGRVRLFVLFQGYLSVFSAQVIVPILRNLAGKGTPKEQINAAAIMLATIYLGFLGQAIKDEIKYGDRPTWLTDAEYFQRGVQASGLMGQTERIFNLFFPLYGSEEDTIADRAWGEVGPLAGTIDSAAKSLEWAMEGEGERAINKALKISPVIGTFTTLRQSAAKEIADLFGE